MFECILITDETSIMRRIQISKNSDFNIGADFALRATRVASIKDLLVDNIYIYIIKRNKQSDYQTITDSAQC